MLTNKVHYSIIIPTIGRWKYLFELLDSIRRQVSAPKEVIILLNEREEYKEQELNELYSKCFNLNMKIIHSNLNLAGKRNLGVQSAQTRLVFFSDDDDIWAPQKASVCLAQLEFYPVVTHNFSKFGDVQLSNCSKLGKVNKEIALSIRLPGDNVYGGGSSIIVRKEVAELVPFDVKMPFCEDLDWWLRILFEGKKIKYIGDDLVAYRSHSSNMTNRDWLIFKYTLLTATKLSLKSPRMFLLCGKIIIRATMKLTYKLVFK